jgi:hypothetical protein
MISYAVMAHPSRGHLVGPLMDRLGVAARVIYDQGKGEWDTGRRALLAYDVEAEWHAVIQDDAILADRFVDALELVTAHAGEHPLGLYCGQVRPMPRVYSRAVAHAEKIGSPWLEHYGPRWGVAICLPTRFIPALVASADLYRHPHYDARVTRFFRMANVWARYPLPSLDHPFATRQRGRRPSRLSLLGRRRPARDRLDARPGEDRPARLYLHPRSRLECGHG